MLQHRPADARGHVKFGWLDTWHTFSFGSYHDPRYMGHSVLRVINDDFIRAHSGFDTHGHRNMEILTCMLQGTLSHRDSMGHHRTLQSGEWQMLSAGQGITHSEMNHGDIDVHLLQIWLHPQQDETEPCYQQKTFDPKPGMTLIASPDAHDDSFKIGQDVYVWQGRIAAGTVELPSSAKRLGWLHVIQGELGTHGLVLNPGDGLAITHEQALTLQVTQAAEFIFFDLP
ncbi:MAG: pirin family protein [Pseudomonadales bacterium]|nr:pirin family protein [Pseudomonadales bacterium]